MARRIKKYSVSLRVYVIQHILWTLAYSLDMKYCSYSVRQDGYSLTDILPVGYDKLRPPSEKDHPANVTIRIAVLNIRSLDEKQMSLAADIFLHQVWKDHRLLFPHTSSRSKLVLDVKWREHLWTPDTFFKNSLEGKVQDAIIPYMYLWLYNDSTIFFSSRLSMTFGCEMSFHRFPHDTQACSIKIMSLSHTTNHMVLHWKDGDGLQLTDKLLLPQFEIVRSRYGDCSKTYDIGTFSCLNSTLELRRRTGYYIINIYIPCIMIVAMAMLTFWIPPEAVPARVTLGVTSLLTIVTKQYQSSLPAVSYVVALNIWMSCCIGFVFLSLLEYAVVISLTTLKPQETSKSQVKPITNGDDKKFPCNPRRAWTVWTNLSDQAKKKYSGNLLDKIARILFPLAFLIQCITYASIYGLN
ncbi:glycine receptor subunit alpha-2-like [Tachypleus tridentatus]|uniref:glycine receptor subunit alpha-2-like n=1 Tax=Tachypleus tridentatus TaxID=6853 RepID=UPI003FD62275